MLFFFVISISPSVEPADAFLCVRKNFDYYLLDSIGAARNDAARSVCVERRKENRKVARLEHGKFGLSVVQDEILLFVERKRLSLGRHRRQPDALSACQRRLDVDVLAVRLELSFGERLELDLLDAGPTTVAVDFMAAGRQAGDIRP